ncbi:MAG: adenosylcobinamide-GDP ribazoletransferase [Actinobacteria bacterium]|nr:adenosylcobinamide-GDP ribazoletransferase [Actinomycetota bacterium]
MSIRPAFAFLTSLGGARDPEPGMVAWFPVVGAAVGAIVGGSWWLAGRIWPAAVAAAIALSVDLGVTGLLHADGLVDAADGLLPHMARDRRLAVMREPAVGAYGIAVGAAVLLLRFTALAALHANVLLIAAVWCASRTAMAVAAHVVPYARADDGGLATGMFVGRWQPVGGYGAVAAFALGAVATGWSGAAAVAACFVGATAVVVLGRRQLGGYTGDVLGAAGLVGETVALLVAAAKW